MLQAHIQLDDSIGAKYAILPGDPARIDRIKPFLTDCKELKFNREYRSVSGYYKGIKVIAISTGMGGSSASIAVEELHNIGVEAMVRIGSCGALQEGIRLGDLVIGCGAIRDDGASRAYIDIRYPAVPDTGLLNCVIDAAKEKGFPHHVGVIHSHESFYMDSNEEEEAYWARYGTLGSDFESAALFTVGRIRHVKTASILNNVVEKGGNTAESVSSYAGGTDMCAVGELREIEVALEALYKLSQK